MSFSDMMSSGRGPGVIGMLMALVVLIGFGLLFMFAFDEGFQGGAQSIESVIASQAKEIEGSQNRIASGEKTLATAPALIATAKEVSRFKHESQSLKERISVLKTGIETANADIVGINKNFEEYKDQYRAFVRSKAKGETMPVLETKTGIIYKNVNIREVTPVGIQIRHDEGQKRIPFEELPDSMVDYYQFDPNQKAAALADENASRDVHEAEAAAAGVLADQAMAEQRAKDAAEKREKTLREVATKEAQIDGLRGDIRGLQSDLNRATAEANAARAAGRMHLNKSNSIGANINSKQNRISALRSEIDQMKSSIQP
ncbi:MAG: hypothetical protein ABI162_16570 [Luteolibacter sp.]